MQRITFGDQRKLSVFVRELYCLNSVELILDRVAQGLDTLIAADSVFVPMAGPERKTITLLADNIGSELHEMWPVLVALRHENPAISHHMCHPEASAFMIGDLFPMSQWTRTAVFNEFYSRLGMRERLSLSLSFSRPDIVGVVAHRSRRSFTERDRSVLNLLRFHVSQACITAKARVSPPLGPVMEALESLVGGSIVAVDSGGKPQFASDRARQDFESFFSQEKPFCNGLPLTVGRWACREIVGFGTCELSGRPPQPLVVRIDDRTLRIRIASARERRGYVLLLRVEDPTLELAKMSFLGLGVRPTEVLYWLAKGKTNREIGIILGMAAETVKAHLKSIYLRLELENRATAASMISELLVGG